MFFIADAYAQDASSQMGAIAQMAPLLLMFVMIYFLFIRPQQKRQKELRAMLDALKKGDEVSTIGGIVGKVVGLDDNFVTLDVGRKGNSGNEIILQRSAVQSVLPNGSLK